MKRIFLALLTAALCATGAWAQALPRIAALYPPGARAGSTVEVAIRGGGLEGAREVLVDGGGITAKLNDTAVKVDPADQKVFTAKCALCHDLRGPATISRTADQWVATVDRMIREKAAPIGAADRAKIVSYVQAAARSAAGLTARVTVAANAAPGRREVRVVAANGTSTVFPFEVTRDLEVLEAEPNNSPDKAQPVTPPAVISGQIANTQDVDCYQVFARRGQRLVFACDAYRLNPAVVGSFMPVLTLYDGTGRFLTKNYGHNSLDPLIDFTVPADGRYVVEVRDMLYRGTPASIYRLRVGSIPYDTYLFPPGGKRGTTTQATLGGQNMQPALVPIALPADAAPGVREVSTPRGTFKFAVGEFPEYVEPAESGPHAVTVPVSINGRLAAAGEEDQYRFSLTKEQLGSYSFECFADRVGSPVVARLRLRDAKGQVIAASTDNGSRDPRLDVTLGRPGDYTLEVSDAAGKGGPECVYRVSAGTASPDFVVTVSPDNPNLGPGASLYLQVRVRRKVGITGDIQIRFRNLPPGVTASPTVIARDQTDGYVILTAAPDAKPGTFSAVTVEGVATVDGKQVVRPAAPHEVYRINNNAVDAERGTMVVTVGPEQGWRVSLQPESTSMGTNAPIKVKVKLDRRGMEGDLPFAIVGLPQSVQAPGSLLFKRGTSEMTFTMTPRAGGGPDPARRRRSLGGISEDGRFLIAVVNGREGEGMMMASPAVAITMKE